MRGKPIVRVGARCIVVRKGRVLVQRAGDDPAYRLPGGRLEALETLEQCAKREMLEELGVDVDIAGLAFVNENFYWYRGRLYHEIMFYYNCKMRGEPVRGRVPGLTFEWKSLDELDGILRPKAILPVIKLIVERGGKAFCNKYILTVEGGE